MARTRRLYLDKDHAKLSGVCAGIAAHFGWDPSTVRIVWVIATFFWSPIMICAYILMAWLLDPMPTVGFATSDYYDRPWPSDPTAPRRRLVDVKDRFDRLESRLRTLETVVASPAFRIDRELKS